MKQVAETLRLIQANSKLPIQRARMRVRVVFPAEYGDRLEGEIESSADHVEKKSKGEVWEMVWLDSLPPQIDHLNDT